MEPNDLLSSLLSDPQKLQSAISMASSLFGGGSGTVATPTAEATSVTPSASLPTDALEHTAATLASLFPSQQTPSANTYDPTSALMSKMLPMIQAIAQSSQHAISHEKANFLNAIKPFVSDGISSQLDHAMRLVSMARMARSAMGQLGISSRASGNLEPSVLPIAQEDR